MIIPLQKRQQCAINPEMEGTTKDIPWSVLLGLPEASNEIPKGYMRSPSLNLKQGTDCFAWVVRSGQWTRAKFHDYCDRGDFAEVKIGDRIVKVFGAENLAIKA